MTVCQFPKAGVWGTFVLAIPMIRIVIMRAIEAISASARLPRHTGSEGGFDTGRKSGRVGTLLSKVEAG